MNRRQIGLAAVGALLLWVGPSLLAWATGFLGVAPGPLAAATWTLALVVAAVVVIPISIGVTWLLDWAEDGRR